MPTGAQASTYWNADYATLRAVGLTPYVSVPENAIDATQWHSSSPLARLCPNATYAINLQNPYTRLWDLGQSYGMNGEDFFVLSTPRAPIPYSLVNGSQLFAAYKASKVRNASEKLCMADSMSFALLRQVGSQQYAGGEFRLPVNYNNVTAYRHFKGANVVFFDGHGEWRPRATVDTTGWSQSQIDRLWYAYR